MTRFGWLFAALTMVSAPVWAASDNVPPPGSAPPPMAAMLPGPAAPGMARIYIYREDANPLHPEWTAVWLDHAKVGDSAPGTFFYRDVPPGTHLLSVSSDLPYVDEKKTVALPPNGTLFVKVYAVEGFGMRMNGGFSAGRHGGGSPSVAIPNVFGERIVDPRIAQPEISRLQPAG
jgi:hypothetical protein